MAQITCCLFVPIYPAAIVISILGVLAGGGFGVYYARMISTGLISVNHENPLMNIIPYFGLACWMLLALISLYGAIVTLWLQRTKLVVIYFWAALAHYIIDLAFLIPGIVIVYQDGKADQIQCLEKAGQSGFTGAPVLCPPVLDMMTIVFIAALCVFKIISGYTTFALYQYKRYVQSEELLKQKASELEAQQIRDATWNKSYDVNNPPASWSKFED